MYHAINYIPDMLLGAAYAAAVVLSIVTPLYFAGKAWQRRNA